MQGKAEQGWAGLRGRHPMQCAWLVSRCCMSLLNGMHSKPCQGKVCTQAG